MSWKRPFRLLGMAVLLAQFGVLVARSTSQWHHFNLSMDFSSYHQAWYLIGHGRLSPSITVYGYPFWRSHFELIMWPLAFLGRLWPPSLFLLVLQDAATVGAELAAYFWLVDRMPDAARHRRPTMAVACAVALGLFLSNPWIYRASLQDFHLEAVALFFATLTARDLFAGRQRRTWIWAALALASGDVAGTYLAGVGISGVVAGRRVRKQALFVLLAGVAWVAFIAVLGANKGSGAETYGYLIGKSRLPTGIVGAFTLLTGIVRHPSKTLHVLSSRSTAVWDNIASVGVVGILTPFGIGVCAVVLAENVLHQNGFYAVPSFQNLPVYIFGTAGTAGVLLSLAMRRTALFAGAALVVVIATLSFSLSHFDGVSRYHVSRPTAKQLDMVLRATKPDDEVVASFGVVGRFAGRRFVHPITEAGLTVPVRAPSVVFVFAPTAGNQPVPRPAVESAINYVRDTLHADALDAGSDVFAFRWRPPAGVTSVQLPAQ